MKTKVSISFEFGVLSVSIKEKEAGQKTSHEIGCLEAELTEKYLNDNPKFKMQIIAFGEHLAKQMKCDGVKLHSINFSRINYE